MREKPTWNVASSLSLADYWQSYSDRLVDCVNDDLYVVAGNAKYASVPEKGLSVEENEKDAGVETRMASAWKERKDDYPNLVHLHRTFLFCSTSPRMLDAAVYTSQRLVGITTAGSKSFFRSTTRLDRMRTIVIDYISLIEAHEALKTAHALLKLDSRPRKQLHSLACTYVRNDSFN